MTKTISGVQRKQTTNDWSREAVYMPECFDKCAQAYCTNSSKKKRFWKNNDFLTQTHAIFLTQSLVNIYGLAAAVCVFVCMCGIAVAGITAVWCDWLGLNVRPASNIALMCEECYEQSPEATFPSCLALSQPSAVCLT